MFKSVVVKVMLSLAISACDSGLYDHIAHRDDGSPTGSLLSGTDTGVNPNSSIGDAGIGSNKEFGSPGSSH